MVKKSTNEHDYFKNIKDFLTYHFNKTPGNETKLANVLELQIELEEYWGK